MKGAIYHLFHCSNEEIEVLEAEKEAAWYAGAREAGEWRLTHPLIADSTRLIICWSILYTMKCRPGLFVAGFAATCILAWSGARWL